MIEAVSAEGIGEQPLLFNGVMAGFADPVGSIVHLLEREIDLPKQLRQVVLFGNLGERTLKPLASLGKL
jgi:hypothetical protein